MKRLVDVFMNKFDHFVFNHKLGSILMTFLFIVAIFFVFFIFKPTNAEGGNSSFGYLVGIFSQGLLNWPNQEGNYDTYLLIMSTLGTFLISGVLYAAITNALIGRSDVYKDGKLRYQLAGHTVIFGSSTLLESILDYLDKNEKFKKQQSWIPKGWEWFDMKQLWKVFRQKKFCNYIVIVSSHKPQTIRNRANRYSYIRNHVVIYNDELDDDKAFNKVCLEKAREVYVIGDEEPKITDALNVHLVNMIINKAKDRRKDYGRLSCNVSYFDSSLLMATLSDTNNDLEKPEKRDYIEIRPYNYLDGCLSFYWGNKCVERLFSNGTDKNNTFSLMPTNGKGYHFVIIGFNDLACCCVRKICSLAHFGKEYKTSITMITNASQQFCYFKEELGVEKMHDITLECKASLEELGKEEDETLRYYVVATTDATMDNMLINHLSSKKHACLLGYAEDYELEIDTKITYFATKGQHLGYWGFKKLRTHVAIGKQEYNHARLLFEANKNLIANNKNNNNKDFCQLNPMEQKAWIDFYNYLYYLIRVSGCKLQSRPGIDTQAMSESEINAESTRQQKKAEENTLASLDLVADKIQFAIINYNAAYRAMHGDDSIAKTHYLDQLDNICTNYKKIVAEYLAKAKREGLELVVQ